ncbi:MAG: hypothetical protein ACLUYV_05240 [Alistipes shahii]
MKMGNTIPRWVGGVNLSVAWKGLSLYARFDYATGYVAKNSRKQYYMGLSQGTFNTLKESKDTWSERRPDAKYPILMYADTKFRNNYRMSNIFYDDSSYLCAREIALSYSLPEVGACGPHEEPHGVGNGAESFSTGPVRRSTTPSTASTETAATAFPDGAVRRQGHFLNL